VLEWSRAGGENLNRPCIAIPYAMVEFYFLAEYRLSWQEIFRVADLFVTRK
jgi:hypothetical protein